MWAKKYYADLSTGGAVGNATWTAATNTFAWTASSYAYMVVPGGSFSGDLSEYTTIGLTVSGLENEFRVDILANGKTFTGKSITADGNIVLDIFSDFNKQWAADKITVEDLKSVEAVRLNTNSASGSAVVTKFYIGKPASLSFDETGTAELDFTDLITTGGLSFDEETGVLTNDGTGGTLYVNMPTEGIDFTNMTAMTVNRSGDDLIDHSEIKDTENSISNGFWGSRYGVNFTTGDAMKFNSATNVNSIVWTGNTTEGSMTISSIVFKANVITCTLPGSPVVLNTLQYHNMDGTNATATWNMDTATDTYYGSGSSGADHYVDLTGYEELRIHRDTKTGFRAFFINATASGTNNITNNTTGTVSWNETESYWVIDLSKVEKYSGKVYLNTIKSESWGVNNIVNNITLYKTPVDAPNYILAGKGTLTPAAATALTDANATYIDATGITGASLLTSANPNCVFTANAGMLTNTQNVIVDGTCANLVLTDGKPFALPTSASATEASYTRTMPNTFGTICLPFAVSSDENVQYYTTDGVVNGALQLEEAANVAAGTPAIVFAEGKSLSINGSGTLAVAGEADGDAQLIGSFAEQVIDVTEDASKNYKNYYGIANNQFTKAISTLTVKPFRAYLTTTASSPAKLRLGIADDEASAISALTADDATVKAIYNASGAKQQCLQKGLNIVKMSNGVTTKVFVK